MDGLPPDLHCALLPRGAALPRWIRAISQDRERGRCDHDPILEEMVKKCMCSVTKDSTEKRETVDTLARDKGNSVKSLKETRNVRTQSVCITAALLHPRRRTDSVAMGPRADSVYVRRGQQRSLRLLQSCV